MLERVCAKWWSPQGQGKSLNLVSSAEDCSVQDLCTAGALPDRHLPSSSWCLPSLGIRTWRTSGPQTLMMCGMLNDAQGV